MHANIKADKELPECAGETKTPCTTHELRPGCSKCWDGSVVTAAMKKPGVPGESRHKSSMPGKMAESSEDAIK